MGVAYTPGLTVSSWTEIEKIRELPLPGKALVKVGDRVEASQVVLTAELPGELEIVRLSDRLGVPPEEALPALKARVGMNVEKREVLAELSSFFGLFNVQVESPCSGTVEFLTETNAHLGIRRPATQMNLRAYVDGEVVHIEERKSVTIRAQGAQIQGIFGVGGERHGNVLLLPGAPDQKVRLADIEQLGDEVNACILIGGSSFESAALRRAAQLGAVAVITGSIDSETLRDYVGFEIGVSITGDEDVPLTLIVTEGFGNLALSPRIHKLAQSLVGKPGSVSGATQVRAGALRPELFVSLPPPNKTGQVTSNEGISKVLEVGSRIRVIRVPYFGQFGTVREMPHEPQAMPCGSIVRVLRAVLEDGTEVVVPRANVELSE